jgi:hypothetical protein
MKSFAIALLLLFSSALAFAEEGSVSLKLDDEIETESASGSSAVNRRDKEFILVASPFGVGPSGMPEAGVSIGRYLTPSTIAQLELGTGNNNDNNDSWGFSNSSRNVTTNSASVNVKHFVSNSFYVKGGLDHRSVDYEYNYGNTFLGLGNPNGPRSSYSFNGDSWSTSFAIGNQWQWENFTLGCDWIGVTLPLAYTIRDEKMNDNLNSDTNAGEIRARRSDNEDKYVKQVAVQAVKFYLGASF